MFFYTVASPGVEPSLQGSGDVHVAAGASIGGNMSLTGGRVWGSGTFGAPGYTAYCSGVMQPGDGVGTLTIASRITMRGTLELELDGASNYDRLSLGTTGGMDLLNGRLSLLLGFDPEPTDALTILAGVSSSPQITGTFLDAPNNALIEIGIYNGVRYLGRIHYSSNSITLDSFQTAPIPEPGSLVLVAIAGCGIACRRMAARVFNS